MQYLFLLYLVIEVLLYLFFYSSSKMLQQTIKMYYVKTVDLTRKKRRIQIPGKDANTPSEEVTEVGSLCLGQRCYHKENNTFVSLQRRFLRMHGCLQTALNTRTLSFLTYTLAEIECILQADFSENYMCHFLEEISSIYSSKDQVKVCPAMIHYKGVNGVQYLKHKSLAVLSDEMTKYCIIKVIVGWIKHVSIGTSQS